MCRPLILLAALLVLVAPARGDEIVINALFGWGWHTPAERWSPLVVNIHSPERSISGTMLIEYAQDHYQQAQIAVPFSAQAGATTPNHALVALPRTCDQVRITLMDERGRRVATENFTGTHMRGGPIGSVQAYASGLIVSVGVPRLPQSMAVLSEIRQQREVDGGGALRPGSASQTPWTNIRAVNARPTNLPLAPMAYDGLMTLVVHGDAVAEVSRASLAAIHEWVLAGGRLVVVADTPGEQWRSWLPLVAEPVVELGAPTVGPVPEVLREVILAAELPIESGEWERSAAEPADTVRQRRVSVTESGLREGWRIAPAYAVEQEAEGGGLVAEGPVGFGFVTVLGFDPHRTTQTISSHGAAAVWTHAMQTIGDEFYQSVNLQHRAWSWRHAASRAQQAINVCLEPLAEVPALGSMTFLVIAGAIVLLAVLVGPLDLLLLRRLQLLHRSWLTALVWIVVASGLAIAAPRFVRTDSTQVNRISVIDVLVMRDGSSRICGTGLTGIYAGQAGRAQLGDVDPSSWWRGASALYNYFGSSGPNVPVPTLQGRGWGGGGGNPLRTLPMGQWTFRTFLDQSMGATPGMEELQAVLEGDAESGRVVVTGVPDGVSIGAAALRLADGLYTLNGEGGGTGELVWMYPSGIGRQPGVLPSLWRFETDGGVRRRSGGPARHHPGSALALPGPDRRSAAVERRIESGNWAALYLMLHDCPPYPTLNWQTGSTAAIGSSHTAVIRIVVPLPERPDVPEGTES